MRLWSTKNVILLYCLRLDTNKTSLKSRYFLLDVIIKHKCRHDMCTPTWHILWTLVGDV